MADSNENIFVDFDFNNITIVDPNKVVDENGKAKERYVKQENLVMYANLECQMIPRTKLAVGVGVNNPIQTISVATINFLKPGNKKFMEENYTNELTGKDSLIGKADNQINLEDIKVKRGDTLVNQTSSSKPGSKDNGFLGITSIDIKINTDFMPVITVQLVDVKGKALFEGADNSPYAAFFNLPYPLFHLTIKGYFGKAVRLPLMLQNFTSRFDANSSNFYITLTFYTYKYSMLAELSMGHLQATPFMYQSTLNISPTQNSDSKFKEVKSSFSSVGIQKIKEMYSEYKAKGLIDKDFPEISLATLQNRIEKFVENILDSFVKNNMDSISFCDDYRKVLEEYQKKVYYGKGTSWFEIYVDKTDFYVTRDKKQKIYKFTPVVQTQQDKNNAIDELNKIIIEFNGKLESNPTLGKNGTYTINKNPKSSSIPNPISIHSVLITNEINLDADIDLETTFQQRNNSKKIPTTDELQRLRAELQKQKLAELTLTTNPTTGEKEIVNTQYYFWFDGGPQTFLNQADELGKKLKEKRQVIENELTDALNSLLQNKSSGIGFVPTIRNVLAVVFANLEAFIRLMDDVHTTAWKNRNEDVRKEAIFDTNISNASADTLDSGLDDELPVYPWPQFILATSEQNGQEKYELRYPGEEDVIDKTKGYLHDMWPEIEFVEEYLKGFTQRENPPIDFGSGFNELLEPKRMSLNAIEFPILNEVYSNKEEIKFYFEIYERVLLSVFYSKMSRVAGLKSDGVINQTIANIEKTNLLESLSNDNPYIIKKLKEYNFNGSNFLEILRSFSNEGVGESWQNYIRGIFNTSYIKNLTENSNFEIISSSILDSTISQPSLSLKNEDKLVEFIKVSTKSNSIDFTDTYPFTDLNWIKKYLAGSEFVSNTESAMDTRDVLEFNTQKKSITNFSNGQPENSKKPFTNFVHLTGKIPNIESVSNAASLKTLFESRTPQNQAVTEGEIFYKNFTGKTIFHQTTSIFNTPYFINAIQNGVEEYNQYSPFPFVQAAFLFINSLPVGTLRDKYKTFDNSSVTDLSYIFATIKKFAGVHQVPFAFVLKIGSIWHRYKTYVQTGKDILTTAWSGFNYTLNFDPVNQNSATTYSVIFNNSSYDISLQKNTIIGTNLFTTINTGFYPKLINDFNIFYQGYQIFTGYTNTDIQSGITKDLSLNLLQTANIIEPKGFDPNNSNRTIQVTPWSILVDTDDNQSQYVLPSHGSPINQTFYECFETNKNTSLGVNKMKSELINNQPMYDGSVRLFWGIPNYGYFDNSKVSIPQPDEYMRLIFTGESQENFSINGNPNSYTKISELFSVFEKTFLDKMEQEFLNFSKTIYDFDDTLSVPKTDINVVGGDKTTTQRIYQNFQALIRNMMILPKSTQPTSSLIIDEVIQNQFKNVQNWVGGFLNYNVILKFGNPTSFDRKLFYSFSSLPFTDPIVWENYTSITPNALPTNGGVVTLSSSKLNYPNAWKTLETFVGFSEIPSLIYSDNGSYITDFFVDMNVAFTEQNIIQFAPIIKIYATQKLTQFSKSPVPPPQPSISNPPQLVTTANLQDGSTAEILKSPGLQKRVVLKNPQGQIFYVGTAVNPLLTIQTNNRDLIIQTLDAFYGNFLLNPIVGDLNDNPSPSYPTTPSSQIKNGFNKFIDSMDEYIRTNENIQTDIFNELFGVLRKELPNISVVPQQTYKSVVQGMSSKLELWEAFKSLNDKWISGGDFKTKTLFEDVLFLDRASRDIGNKIIVDVIKLKTDLKGILPEQNVLSFINSIIETNHFIIMNVPSYVNFYNVQDVVKNAKPQPESTSDFANNLFGTFLNVDYRNSSSKMVCQYGGRPSSVLDINNNVDYRYRNDAYDLTKAAGNPVLEDLSNKNDFALSNKVVGFNVDIGTQNQSIFTNFSVSQEQGLATAESLEILNQMANQAGNRKGSTQSVSLYNVYKNRSYTCSVEMMGNAIIQPTMYFNLRYVPMFSGPYMIMSVNHSIRPGSFFTTFTGIRQPVASLPKIDSYIQSLRTTLLDTLQTIFKQQQDAKTPKLSTNKISQASSTSAVATENKDTNVPQTCEPSSTYDSFEPQTNPLVTKLSVIQMKLNIVQRVNDSDVFGTPTDKEKLKVAIFVAAYLFSYQKSEQNFIGHAYNFTGVDLTQKWPGSASNYFDGNYFCAKTSKTNIPYAQFKDLTSNVKMLAKLWDQRMSSVEITKESMTKFWVANRKATNLKGQNLVNEINQLNDSGELKPIYEKIDSAIKLYNNTKP